MKKKFNHFYLDRPTNRGKLIFAAFFLLTLTLLISNCARESKKKQFVIGFSQCTGADNWRKATLEGVKKEISFYPGTKLIYKNAEDNSDLQIKQIRELIKQKIDILLVSPNEAQPLTPVVEEAFNKGIPVVIIDRKTSSDLYTSFVGVDNFEIGKMAGNYIANIYHDTANVIEVIGLPGSTPAGERNRGFKEGISLNKKVIVKAQVYGNWLKEKSFEELLKIKDKLSSADIVFAHNDPMALGAYEVYKKLGIEKNVRFVGVDGLSGPGGGIQFVSDKIFEATLLNPTGGEEAIQVAFKILNKEPFNKENTLQTVVIDSTNVRIMKLQSDKIQSQQRDIERQQAILEEQQRIYNNQRTFLDILIMTLVIAVSMSVVVLYSLRENRKINKSLNQKNEEILKHEEQLIKMSAKTQAANDAKLKFFTNISHEFRTPLTLILAPLEQLLSDSKLNFRFHQQLVIIHKNAIRLLRLVNQLMDFRKIEFDKLKLRATENDLIEFISEITDAFKPLAKKKNIQLNLITTERKVPVWFDINMLDKVMFNLLSNSFKFTNENGYVQITIEKDTKENVISIKVQDNGVGMSKDALNHAFEQFYQGEYENYKGTGLGLALSKELILLHHGSITVDSEKWKGTTFRIKLPLDAAHLQKNEMAEKDSLKPALYEDEKIYLTDLEPEFIHKRELLDFNQAEEYSVLIIEDNPDLRYFLCSTLSYSYKIFEAENSNSAMQQALDEVPDVIICDVVIPGKDGLELTNIFKSDIRTSHIPIILLTAKSGIQDQIAGMKNMADAYIIKPFNLQFLEQTIKSLLVNRAKLKEHYTSDLTSHIKLQNSKLDRKFINEFKAQVEANIANENFCVEDICKSMFVSKVQLHRKIKALLDCNANDYILNSRLQKAKYFLQHEELTIGEVASKVGFSTQAYFATVFKSKFGITPTAFKDK